MKPPSRPKSSPARTSTTTRDEFPPPLIMFPRSKSCRSSRSRASTPMFINKIKINKELANQEPLSPKVTCMGQVRVNRSHKHKTTSFASTSRYKLLPRWLRRVWRGRIWCFRCHCCRKSKKLRGQVSGQVRGETGDVMGACKDELIAEPSPRNGFLLTRSRSAPYRLWDNRIIGGDDERRKRVGDKMVGGDDERRKRVGDKMVVKEEEGHDINEEFKGKVKQSSLSRCKSEPARTGDKIFMSFSLSFTYSS